VKALADEDLDDTSMRSSVSYAERKYISLAENGFLLGCGIRAISRSLSSGITPGSGDHVWETMFFPLKGTGKRFLGPLASKPFAYLSAFILYIATIGDVVDGVDTTHDFNFFQLVYEKSNDVSLNI
jgi:zinc finger FYVE domain-containing protein 26